MKKYFIAFLFICFSLKAETTVNVSKELKNIPVEECEKIQSFFYKLIRYYGFGYTLFGNAPVSTVCWLTTPDFNTTKPHFSVDEEFVDAYKVWKKYSHKFPSKKFIFSERSLFTNKKYTDLFLINKSEFNKKIRLYPNHFSDGYNINTFIENEKAENYHLENELDDYHIRMGILLGYGEENAIEFTKRRTKPREKDDLEWTLFMNLVKSEPKKNVPFPSVFLVKPHTRETQDLIKEFRQTQEKLCNLLNSEKFLHLALEEYCTD